MVIVALSGWKGSGKDLVASHLVDLHNFKRISFADPLKDQVAEQFGIDRTSLDDRVLKESPIQDMPVTPKDTFSQMVSEFMVKEFRSADGRQPLGAAYTSKGFMGTFTDKEGRSVYETLYWTPRALAILEGSSKRTANSNHWVDKAVAQMDPGGRYVIADVRYQSELSALMAAAPNQVVAIRIERFDSSPSSDPSERDLDAYPFPFKIDNRNATKEHVFDQADQILRIKEVIDEIGNDQNQAAEASHSRSSAE